jgi:hypothetical protein
MVLPQQNYHTSMYNIVYKRMLSCNHFSVDTFTLYLYFLFKKNPTTTCGVSPSCKTKVVSHYMILVDRHVRYARDIKIITEKT